MAKEVIMPALGMAQESGILLAWLKKEGEYVGEGEPLMEVETDKATVEVDAPASGILSDVRAQPGDEVPVAEVIAWILAPGEESPLPTPHPEETPEKTKPSSEQAPQRESRKGVEASPVAARVAASHDIDLQAIDVGTRRITKADVLAYLEAQQEKGDGGQGQALGQPRLLPASPKARRLAREQGIDLAQIAGRGPHGAVLAADVLAAMTVESVSPPTFDVSHSWRVMVQRLSQAWTTIPHFYLTREVDASRLVAWRDVAQKRLDVRITYTDLLVKVVAAALRQHPRLNASWQEGTIWRQDEVNVGLAVAVDDGLVVPVIRHADQQTLGELAMQRQAVVERAQAGKLKLDDIQGGTFTISNLGMYGVDAFNAIINPPQAALLALGRIAERVVPVQGAPAVRPMIVMTLSCDHRVVDGARGAQFLETLANLIEEPLGLID